MVQLLATPYLIINHTGSPKPLVLSRPSKAHPPLSPPERQQPQRGLRFNGAVRLRLRRKIWSAGLATRTYATVEVEKSQGSSVPGLRRYRFGVFNGSMFKMRRFSSGQTLKKPSWCHVAATFAPRNRPAEPTDVVLTGF